MGNIVSNISVNHGTPASTVSLPELLADYGNGTPVDGVQIYRNTDNKIFEPKLLMATNLDTATIQIVKLVDADVTDVGVEDDCVASSYSVYSFAVGPEDSAILNKDELMGLKFRYGIVGYLKTTKTAGDGVEIYVAGVEE